MASQSPIGNAHAASRHGPDTERTDPRVEMDQDRLGGPGERKGQDMRRLAAMVLNTLLAGQIAFGAAAIVALAMKDDHVELPARGVASVAAVDLDVVVR